MPRSRARSLALVLPFAAALLSLVFALGTSLVIDDLAAACTLGPWGHYDLAPGTLEAFGRATLGLKLTSYLLVVIAWVIALRARAAQERPKWAVPSVAAALWLVVAIIAFGESDSGWQVLGFVNLPFFACMLALTVAGAGLARGPRKSEQATSLALLALPVLAIAVVFLAAFQLHLSEALKIDVVTGSDFLSRLHMLDHVLLDARIDQAAIQLLIGGPVLTLVIVGMLAPQRMAGALQQQRRPLGATAMATLLCIGLASLAHARLARSLHIIAAKALVDAGAEGLPYSEDELVVFAAQSTAYCRQHGHRSTICAVSRGTSVPSR